MTDSSRREFLKQGAVGIAATTVGAATLTAESAPKKSPPAKRPNPAVAGRSSLSDKKAAFHLGILSWIDTKDPPLPDSIGGPVSGKYWVLILGPESDEETNRVCRIERKGPGDAAWVIIASGTTMEPFDGSLTMDEVPTTPRGNIQYRASASYNGGAWQYSSIETIAMP